MPYVTLLRPRPRRVSLDWTNAFVRAPGDGVVLDVVTNPGQFMSTAGPQPLLHLLADGPLQVRADVGLRDLPHLSIPTCPRGGRRVSKYEYGALVTSVGRTVTQRTNFPTSPQARDDKVLSVVLKLDPNALLLPIGSNVTVRFDPCLAKG
jgi:multidrug efflux pump subunit AcrA (membrane-fusion protein)